MDEEDLLKKAYDDYEAGAYSPKLLKPTDVDEVSAQNIRTLYLYMYVQLYIVYSTRKFTPAKDFHQFCQCTCVHVKLFQSIF